MFNLAVAFIGIGAAIGIAIAAALIALTVLSLSVALIDSRRQRARIRAQTDHKPKATSGSPPTRPLSDPAPFGLAGYAFTVFVFSVYSAGFASDPVWIGPALIFGGLGQFTSGMWAFRRGNTFVATAFSTYGAFWLSLGSYLVLLLFVKAPAKDVTNSLGWFFLAFAVFNTYMMFWSLRINTAVFSVFLTLEVTEILLFIGNFNGSKPGEGLVLVGGLVGVLAAAIAFYNSAADVISGMAGRPVLPVGAALWADHARRG